MTAPLTLQFGAERVSFGEPEWVSLGTAYVLWGHQGDAMGRLRLLGGRFSGSDLDVIDSFVERVRALSGAELVVGNGPRATVRVGDGAFLALLDQLGLRYAKQVARYVPGQKGVLDRYELATFRRGRSVKGVPSRFEDVAPLSVALELLTRATHGARSADGAVIARPATVYEEL